MGPPHEAPKTLSVPQAGRVYFDLGRNASYEAARRGEIPTIRIGSRLRAPVIALEQMLFEAGARSRLGPLISAACEPVPHSALAEKYIATPTNSTGAPTAEGPPRRPRKQRSLTMEAPAR
jgi:hypothetical protein